MNKKRIKQKITGPTWLTITRMVLSVIFLFFILVPEVWARILALIFFIIGATTDYIDGKWARKNKIVTNLGIFLDPLADKMLVNLAFLALVSIGVIPVFVFAIILIRDFAVDGVRMMAARNGATIPASSCGKLKTTLQMVALVVLLIGLIIDLPVLSIIGNIILYIALLLTVLSGYDYIAKNWSKV